MFFLIYKIPILCIRVQLFFEPENLFVFQDVSYFAFGVQKISEYSCTRWASLNTGGESAFSAPLNTKGTFLHLSPGTHPVTEIVLLFGHFPYRNA